MQIPIELVKRLREVKRVVVLTGAGISKESGIPTFREAQTGLWAQYDPMELATPKAFQRDPKLVWEWYTWRRGLVREAKPNPGHFALAEMENKIQEFTLITQNIDGFHRQAGSENVIELHGNITRSKCFDNGHIADSWEEVDGVVPICGQCGNLLRPDVVWFGESLPAAALEKAITATQSAEVFLSVGTSALVQPAASLPLHALKSGGVVVEINPDETPITSQVDISLPGPSGEILPNLVRRVWE